MTRTTPSNPFAPDAKQDPYPIYAQLRETTPVYPLPVQDGRLWLVTRYEDAVRALRGPACPNLQHQDTRTRAVSAMLGVEQDLSVR